MKKIFLLGYFLFLFAAVKAQQAKTKKDDVIEYREGHSPQSKAQQKQVKKSGNQTFPKPVDSLRIKPAVGRPKTSERKVDSLTQFIKG